MGHLQTYKEIGLHAQNLLTVIGSIINLIWTEEYGHL